MKNRILFGLALGAAACAAAGGALHAQTGTIAVTGGTKFNYAVVAKSDIVQSVQGQDMTMQSKTDGTVVLAERPPLVGRIDLSPILKAEGVLPGATTRATVQLMMHYGRLYVVADAFRAIWEITPQPGTTTASYRPIPVVRETGQDPMKDVRLSRYGSARSSCLRLDRAGGRPVFITSKGDARDDCP